MDKRCLLAFVCMAAFCDAFVGKSMTLGRQQLELALSGKPTSSYDVDTDEEAEQRLGENSEILEFKGDFAKAGPVVAANGAKGRYDDLLTSLGLNDKLKHAKNLDKDRVVTSYDVFCNREMKQEAITAIGFDMVGL